MALNDAVFLSKFNRISAQTLVIAWNNIGCSMMAKYYTAVPLATMFLFMLYERENYKFFKDYKLYLAILLLIAISLPHVWWLIKYDFVPIQYVLSRDAQGNPIEPRQLTRLPASDAALIPTIGFVLDL